MKRYVHLVLVTCICTMLAGGLLAGCSSDITPVRDSVNDYSWEELSGISAEIAGASDDETGIETAKRYHLINEDGTLDGTQAKEIELADGTKTSVVIAGFRHDDKTQGGKAGITFAFTDAVAMHGMNNNAGYDERSANYDFNELGGWPASEMRAWLNSEFSDSLPVDLRASITEVVKQSCVVPGDHADETDDEDRLTIPIDSLVASCSDKLWLPAVIEVCNPAEDEDATFDVPAWTSVLEAEGTRYQLFSDAETASGSAASARIRSLTSDDASNSAVRWWLRSVEGLNFASIRDDGSLDRVFEVTSAKPHGVVPCFAI